MSWKEPAAAVPEEVRATLANAKHGRFDGWTKITLPETVPAIHKIRHPADNMVYTAYTADGITRVTDDLLQDWTGVC